MIRIDVGDEESRTPEGFAVRSGKVHLPKNLTGGKEIAIDILMALLIIAAVIIALLPQPFLRQYKVMVTERHFETMKQIKVQVANLEKEITALTPYKSELESYRKQQGLVKTRLNVVRNLLAARGTPVNVLDIIGQNLSRRTWLESISFSLIGNKSIEMKGFAYSNEEISDYIDRLSESVYLTQVQLLGVSESGELGLKRFDLRAVPNLNAQ